MSTEREVTISIGAEITGVKGAEVLNRQVQSLEQSTASSLGRLQATASKMTQAGGGMTTSFSRMDAMFQSMVSRAERWSTSIQTGWNRFTTTMTSFEGGLTRTMSGVESLAKSWTIFTGSEQDLAKVIQRLMTISAIFDTMRGIGSLFGGLGNIASTFGSLAAGGGITLGRAALTGAASGGANAAARTTAGWVLENGSTAAVTGGAGGAAMAGVGRLLAPSIPAIVPAEAAGGVGQSMMVGSSFGMSGGTATATPAPAAPVAAAGGLSVGAIAAIVTAVIAMIGLSSVVFEGANGGGGIREFAARSVGAGLSLATANPFWFNYIGSSHGNTGRSADLLNWASSDTSSQAVTDARSRQRRSRRIGRETGISLFELESLDDPGFRFQTEQRNRTQGLRDQLDQGRYAVMQSQLEVPFRLGSRRLSDLNQSASEANQNLGRYDATAGSFQQAHQANIAASQQAFALNPFTSQRQVVQAQIREQERQLVQAEAVSRRFANQPAIEAERERLMRERDRTRSGHGSSHVMRERRDSAERNLTDFNARNPFGSSVTLQDAVAADERRVRLQESLMQLKRQDVQLSSEQLRHAQQTAQAEYQRFQTLAQSHRQQAQSLRDQQRSSAGSFGFLAVDQQERALRIARALAGGRGDTLSREDLEFARGREELSALVNAEGRRRAANNGIFQQIEALAPAGELSRRDRIALNDRQAAMNQNIANNISVALNNNIQLEPNAVARDIATVLTPAIQQAIRTVTETLRNEFRITAAREAAQQNQNANANQANQRAQAGGP